MNATRASHSILILLVVLLAVSLPLVAAQKADEDGDVRVTMNDLPAAVRSTLQQVAGTGIIEDLEEEASGIYSADVIKDAQKFDVEIDAGGTLIKSNLDEENEGCKGKDDDEEDEVTVTLSEVPAAVAATIQNEAGSGTIDEIERESKHGNTFYEADITRDGQEIEVKVAEDGALIKSKIEDHEEDDD